MTERWGQEDQDLAGGEPPRRRGSREREGAQPKATARPTFPSALKVWREGCGPAHQAQKAGHWLSHPHTPSEGGPRPSQLQAAPLTQTSGQ